MSTKHFFNITSPCNPDRYYMLSHEECLVGAQLHRYINDELSLELHAPVRLTKRLFRKVGVVGSMMTAKQWYGFKKSAGAKISK